LENEALNKNIGHWKTTLVGYGVQRRGPIVLFKGKFFSVFVFIVLVFVSFKCGWVGICSLW